MLEKKQFAIKCLGIATIKVFAYVAVMFGCFVVGCVWKITMGIREMAR